MNFVNVRRAILLFLCIYCTVGVVALSVYARVNVRGYTRKDGTYVAPHFRSDPDGSPYNNYSYPGNFNPNTGKITPGNPDTYLNQYYSNYSGGAATYYDPTPICPTNSTWNGSACTCNTGYIANVKATACVQDKQSICVSRYGFMSYYAATDNTCRCTYGFVFGDNDQCVSGTSFCASKYGAAIFKPSDNNCYCEQGTSFNPTKGVCEQKNIF